MGENNTCCTWKVDTNGGTRRLIVQEFSYGVTAGYGAPVYKCIVCSTKQLTDLVRANVASAGWAGKIN